MYDDAHQINRKCRSKCWTQIRASIFDQKFQYTSRENQRRGIFRLSETKT